MDLAALTLDLVWVDSPTGAEGPVADRLEAILADALAPGSARVWRTGDNLVVDVAGTTDERPVALAGHLDVVAAPATLRPRLDRDAGVLWGRGTSDMKSGVAVIVDLLAAAARRPPARGLVGLFYAGEEGPADGNELGPVLDALIAAREPQAVPGVAICLEPTANALQLGCVGSTHAELVVHGRSAHSARPWQGENAVTQAAGLLARLGAHEAAWVTVDGLDYAETWTVTTAHGGTGRNVVPGTFTLNLNVRFPPGRAVEDVRPRVEAFVGDDAEVRWSDSAASALPHRDHPAVAALEAALGTAPEPKQAWTDVATFAARDIPAVNVGPGDPRFAHQDDERVDVAAIDRCRTALGAALGVAVGIDPA